MVWNNLHQEISVANENSPNIIKNLLYYKTWEHNISVNPNCTDEDGNTPLHLLFENISLMYESDGIDIIESILDIFLNLRRFKLDIQKRNQFGDTILHLIVRNIPDHSDNKKFIIKKVIKFDRRIIYLYNNEDKLPCDYTSEKEFLYYLNPY